MVKRFLTIIILLILIFGLVLGIYLLGLRTQLPGRASSVGTLSLENSYLFASPLVAKVGGEKITISAFVLSDQGLGIPNQKVIIYSSPTLLTTIIRDETDSRGLAVFEVTSNTAGQFELWTSVVGKGQIKQQVKVAFSP